MLLPPLALHLFRMVHVAYLPSPMPRQVGWNLFPRTIPFASAFPRTLGGSAPASLFSGPAQRSLTLQPARSPSRLCDPLHQRLQQSRCLHRCSDCYRVERTSSRAGIPPLWTSAFTAHPVSALVVGKFPFLKCCFLPFLNRPLRSHSRTSSSTEKTSAGLLVYRASIW